MPHRAPFILIQLGSQAQDGAALPFNSLGVGGGDSCGDGPRVFWKEGHIPSRAERHRECPCSEVRQDLCCRFSWLLLPQTLEHLCLCFLCLSVVPNAKSSIQEVLSPYKNEEPACYNYSELCSSYNRGQRFGWLIQLYLTQRPQ